VSADTPREAAGAPHPPADSTGAAQPPADPAATPQPPAGPYRLVIQPGITEQAGLAGQPAPPEAAPTAQAPRAEHGAPARPASADSAGVRARLLRVPGIAEVSPGRFEFGARDADGVMTLEVLSREVQIAIPRPWALRQGAQVFALVFMAAEWLAWEVYDPQIGSILRKESVLQGMVAMRQAQQQDGRKVPQPQWTQQPPGASQGGKDQDPWKRP
jgi:hypothetical protein